MGEFLGGLICIGILIGFGVLFGVLIYKDLVKYKEKGRESSNREVRFQEIASREVTENQFSQAIYGKAFSLATGDEQKAKELYIKLRVNQLEREYQLSIEWLLKESWPEIEGKKKFLCPYCETRTTAALKRKRDPGFSWFARYQYFCNSCNAELQISGVPSKAKTSSVSLGQERKLKEQHSNGPESSDNEKKNNPMALAGFILGIISVFLFDIGLIPLAGIVCSAVGLSNFDAEKQKNRWMACWGLGLSIVYTLMFMGRYGHLGQGLQW